MQLYTPFELDQSQEDFSYLAETMHWVKNFLAKPHPDLGRGGPVCPFLPRTLKLNTLRLVAIRGENLSQQQVEELVKGYRDIFLELDPQEGEEALYKSILLVFPDISIQETSNIIDDVQHNLKPFFVEAGLMIGEFHKLNGTPGLHNKNFRPLRSPLPMLAIRFMVEADLPFLQRRSDEPLLRIKYLEAYLQHQDKVFKDQTKLDNARAELDLARTQLGQYTLTRKC